MGRFAAQDTNGPLFQSTGTWPTRLGCVREERGERGRGKGREGGREGRHHRHRRLLCSASTYLQILHPILLQWPQRVELGQASLQGGQFILGHPVQSHEVTSIAVVKGALQYQVGGDAAL